MFDHVIQRNERLSKAIRGEVSSETPNGDVTDSSIDKSDESGKNDADKVDKETSGTSTDKSDKEKEANKDSSATESDSKSSPISSLDDQVKDWNAQLVKENKNLHRLNTSLHERNHFLSLKQAEFEELINAEQTKNEELQNKLDDLEYELTKSRMRNGKLETVLVDTQVNTLLEFLTGGRSKNSAWSQGLIV